MSSTHPTHAGLHHLSAHMSAWKELAHPTTMAREFGGYRSLQLFRHAKEHQVLGCGEWRSGNRFFLVCDDDRRPEICVGSASHSERPGQVVGFFAPGLRVELEQQADRVPWTFGVLGELTDEAAAQAFRTVMWPDETGLSMSPAQLRVWPPQVLYGLPQMIGGLRTVGEAGDVDPTPMPLGPLEPLDDAYARHLLINSALYVVADAPRKIDPHLASGLKYLRRALDSEFPTFAGDRLAPWRDIRDHFATACGVEGLHARANHGLARALLAREAWSDAATVGRKTRDVYESIGDAYGAVAITRDVIAPALAQQKKFPPPWSE